MTAVYDDGEHRLFFATDIGGRRGLAAVLFLLSSYVPVLLYYDYM